MAPAGTVACDVVRAIVLPSGPAIAHLTSCAMGEACAWMICALALIM